MAADRPRYCWDCEYCAGHPTLTPEIRQQLDIPSESRDQSYLDRKCGADPTTDPNATCINGKYIHRDTSYTPNQSSQVVLDTHQ